MRIAKLTRGRALSLGLAVTMVTAGTVSLASSSQAAAAPVKLSTITGSSAGGTVVTITGKGFQNDAGTSQVGTVEFNSAVCPATPATALDAATKSVVSSTKVVITTPALALTGGVPTKYNLCVYNTGDTAVVGTATFTSYTPVSNLSITPASGPSFGGTKVTVVGDDFTTKTTAKIGGKSLLATKVTVNAGATDDTLTGTLPAGSGDDQALVVTSEGGSVTVAAAFDYKDAVKVSPAFGNGTIGDVIELTGVGFSSRTWGAAVNQSAIALVAAGVNLAAGQTVPVTNLCASVQVESDTSLSCQLTGAVADGAYSVVLIRRDAATAANIGAATSLSRSAAYMVSDF